MSRSERISQQLGMSHGAAAGQLRKRLLFHYITRMKENICFKCGGEITTADELSIEHKKPWENISVDLFWDIENITFSHLRCNRPHKFNMNEDKKFVAPEGQSWCVGHKMFEPVDKFNKNTSRSSGLSHYCKESRLDR